MTSQNKKNIYWLVPLLMLAAVVILYLLIHTPTTQQGQPNVILITIDSLRPDHLGCCGYERAHTPNIDALARDGVIFRDAFAQGTFTRISVPSIITGMFPLFTKIRTFSGHLDSVHTTVAEVLKSDGYATLATNRMWSLSFYQGFDEMGGSGEQTPERTARAIQGVNDRRDEKFFIWLYYWDPHAPYDPPEAFMRIYEPDFVRQPPGQKMVQGNDNLLRDATGHFNGSIGTLKALNAKEIRLTSLDRKHLIDLYDAEVAYVDQGIGELVAKLKALDLYDNTLIIVNADHGEGFGEHGMWYHGSTVYDEMARVPLIIKPPQQKKHQKMTSGPVRNIDIVSTILDYCGLVPPETWNGHSLRPSIETDATPDLPCIIETQVGRLSHLIALRRRAHKLIYDVQNDKVWLYDLEADPGEMESILPDSTLASLDEPQPKSEAHRLERELRQDLLQTLGVKELADLRPTREDLRPIDAVTKERLKALGYVY